MHACLFLLWRYRAFNRQQRAALAWFVSPRLFTKLTATVSARRRRLKQGVFIAGIACLFVALALLAGLGVEGAIVGKALYAGAFTLAEALAALESALDYLNGTNAASLPAAEQASA